MDINLVSQSKEEDNNLLVNLKLLKIKLIIRYVIEFEDSKIELSDRIEGVKTEPVDKKKIVCIDRKLDGFADKSC